MSRDTVAAGVPLADAFDDAADTYDLMVSLSPGYHAQLRRSARVLVEALPARSAAPPDPVLLDLGCGTGASTRATVAALESAGRSGVRVEGIDASAGMLAQARAKAWPGTVSFHCNDAMADLRARETGSVAGVFAAYLVRNVPDRDALLAQVCRVLTPGGTLVVHDYSVAGNRRAQLVWQAVCRGVIIPSAALAQRDTRLYRYLLHSVQDFDSIPALRRRLAGAGFEAIRNSTVRGWEHGIVHTVAARTAAPSIASSPLTEAGAGAGS